MILFPNQTCLGALLLNFCKAASRRWKQHEYLQVLGDDELGEAFKEAYLVVIRIIQGQEPEAWEDPVASRRVLRRNSGGPMGREQSVRPYCSAVSGGYGDEVPPLPGTLWWRASLPRLRRPIRHGARWSCPSLGNLCRGMSRWPRIGRRRLGRPMRGSASAVGWGPVDVAIALLEVVQHQHS